MKKFLIITAIAACCIACKNNEEIKFTETAADGIEGEYSGTWMRILETDTVRGEGMISFIAGEDPHVANIIAFCPDPAINRAGIANVAHSDYEYVFYNNSADESAGFGTRFSGRVYKDKSIDMQYSVDERVGRFVNTYKFVFIGHKN